MSATISQYLSRVNSAPTPTPSQVSAFINKPMLWVNPATKKHVQGKPDELQKIIRSYTFLYNLGWISYKQKLHFTKLVLDRAGLFHPAFSS